MFGRHVSRQLAAHLDGQLASRESQRVAHHLAQCPRCRDERQQVESGMSLLTHLPVATAPDEIWTAIQAALPAHRPEPVLRWRLATAALAALILAAATFWLVAHRPQRWEITSIHGAPAVDAQPVHGASPIRAGSWIETDSQSSATLKVGPIGSLEVAPNTRLLLVAARSGEHRAVLARGDIHARISAPPRLFFVETASATAVDLGCEYSLHTAEDGTGFLQVTLGWVSFQWNGVESLVPAGASCRTRPQLGPGLPSFDDATEVFQNAIQGFDDQSRRTSSFETVLREARVRDTLTLWHLLPRVERPDRERLYDRIAALTPVPAGISRERVLALDPDTLRRWKEELAWTW